jgi:hypothetical protein
MVYFLSNEKINIHTNTLCVGGLLVLCMFSVVPSPHCGVAAIVPIVRRSIAPVHNTFHLIRRLPSQMYMYISVCWH